jgi:hypothetical protein
MKNCAELYLTIGLLFILFFKQPFITNFANTVLGKLSLVVFIYYITHTYGIRSGVISVIISIILMHNVLEGIDDTLESPDSPKENENDVEENNDENDDEEDTDDEDRFYEDYYEEKKENSKKVRIMYVNDSPVFVLVFPFLSSSVCNRRIKKAFKDPATRYCEKEVKDLRWFDMKETKKGFLDIYKVKYSNNFSDYAKAAIREAKINNFV